MPFLLDLIPKDVESLLDVGCGRGVIGALMRIYRNPRRLVAVDAFRPYLDFCLKHKLYDECIELVFKNFCLPFRDKVFNVATCIEVVEHLPKNVGEVLLSELERVARKVIVTTPRFFFHQEKLDGNPFQVHLSMWNLEDFSKRGYSLYLFERIGGAWVMYSISASSLRARILKLSRKLFLEDSHILATKP